MSTAYTNSNKIGTGIFVEEKIYDLPDGQDPEMLVQSLVGLGPLKVQEREKEILGTYPNTYTFTKSLAERTLKKIHGDLPVSIVRPSIIISCYDQPFQGWTDTMSAGGGLTYAICNGAIKYIKAKGEAIYDVIPCDFVSNTIIV